MPSPLTLPVRYTTRKPPLGTPVRMAHPLAPRGGALWTFGEGSGAVTRDSTPNRYALALTGGVTWHQRRLTFTGSAAQQAHGPAPALSGSPLTMVVGYVPTDFGTQHCMATLGEAGAVNQSWGLYISGASTLGITGFADDNTTTIPAMVAGRAYQSAVTLDGNRHRVLYHQGQAVLSDTASGMFIGDATISVGYLNESGAFWPFAGDIDYLILYSRALSTAEVRALYLAPYSMF